MSTLFRLLLEFKADVNMQDDEGSCPLHYAASAEVTELLLEAGADVNAVNFGRSTALHYAESWAVAEMLILNGANMRAENSYNDMPFVLAVTKGRWSSVLCQLMYGAIRADRADDRAVFGRACSLSEQVLQAYRSGYYRHLFGPSSLLLSPLPLRPSVTHDGRVKMIDTTEIKSALQDVLAAKFERFGTTSVLNQLKTNVVLLLWAKAAATHGLNLPTAGNTHGAGAALVRRERALPSAATPSPQQPARQAHHQRTNQIARAVAEHLVWGPLSALCHHPLSALQQATHLPEAVLRCIVNEFVGWWPLFWTDHLNRMARHASLPARLASTPERSSQHQSEARAHSSKHFASILACQFAPLPLNYAHATPATSFADQVGRFVQSRVCSDEARSTGCPRAVAAAHSLQRVCPERAVCSVCVAISRLHDTRWGRRSNRATGEAQTRHRRHRNRRQLDEKVKHANPLWLLLHVTALSVTRSLLRTQIRPAGTRTRSNVCDCYRQCGATCWWDR